MNEPQTKVKVWDLPLRIFHWLLVILVAVMFISAKRDNFDVHIIAGQALVVLLTARLLWGLVGSSNARFSSWIFAPREYLQYLKTLPQKKPSHMMAHSPIGAVAVIAILIALMVQVASGLVAADVDGLVEGPFAYYVSYELNRLASDIHVRHEKWVLALVILHIAANAFYYFYKKDNLVRPMITGSKHLPQSLASQAPRLAPVWKGIFTALVAAAAVLWVFFQYG